MAILLLAVKLYLCQKSKPNIEMIDYGPFISIQIFSVDITEYQIQHFNWTQKIIRLSWMTSVMTTLIR